MAAPPHGVTGGVARRKELNSPPVAPTSAQAVSVFSGVVGVFVEAVNTILYYDASIPFRTNRMQLEPD
jgi:3',5'-cyclic AMP phosphodiesterase CpdA